MTNTPLQNPAPLEKKRRTPAETAVLLLRWCRATLCCSAKPFMTCACFFLAPFVKWLGIPSPFVPALLLAVPGKSSFFSLLGIGLSLLLRLLWKVELDLWCYAGCGLLWLLLRAAKPSPGAETAFLAAAALLPRTLWSIFRGGMMEILLCSASVPLGMLAAIFFRQAFDVPEDILHRARSKPAVYLLCLMMISALGFLQLFGVNLGQLAAVFATVTIAALCGSLRGIAGGLFIGIALAFCGHDSRIAFSLSMLGVLCGLKPFRRSRVLCIPAAVIANLLAFFVMPLSKPVLGWLPVLLGSLGCFFLGHDVRENIEVLLSGDPLRDSAMENAFITDHIGHLRQAIYSVAKALPPLKDESQAMGAELGRRLCSDCPNREMCWGRSRARTETLMESLMEMSGRGESIGEESLPALSVQGCLRTESIDRAARETLISIKKRESSLRRMQFQRDLTLTHLAATMCTLGDLEILAAGESFSDLEAAHLLRAALDELHIPARLLYARRVDGHLQVSLQAEALMPVQKPLRQLLRKLEAENELSLAITHSEKGRIEMEEVPLYTAALGAASLCAGQRLSEEDEEICGDSCIHKHCEGGRFIMALCDGMGHGPEANAQSKKTLELIMLLMQSGYTRKQAIVAVNGIMLGMQENPEVFSTVDLADVDLWTGEVAMEKLGACASWIIRGNHIKKVASSSLPLGISEEARSTDVHCQLHNGDILILMSDGVADAFADDAQLKRGLEESLFSDPQRMADAIVRNALLASGGIPRDDMTVMVLLLIDRRRQPGRSRPSA